jgi:hypothetical protein
MEEAEDTLKIYLGSRRSWLVNKISFVDLETAFRWLNMFQTKVLSNVADVFLFVQTIGDSSVLGPRAQSPSHYRLIKFASTDWKRPKVAQVHTVQLEPKIRRTTYSSLPFF